MAPIGACAFLGVLLFPLTVFFIRKNSSVKKIKKIKQPDLGGERHSLPFLSLPQSPGWPFIPSLVAMATTFLGRLFLKVNPFCINPAFTLNALFFTMYSMSVLFFSLWVLSCEEWRGSCSPPPPALPLHGTVCWAEHPPPLPPCWDGILLTVFVYWVRSVIPDRHWYAEGRAPKSTSFVQGTRPLSPFLALRHIPD